MDYTILLSSLTVGFCPPPTPVKSALYALACVLEIQLCKTTHRETVHTPEDKASNANGSQAGRRGAPNFCSSQHTGRRLISATGKASENMACLIKTGEKVFVCECVRVGCVQNAAGFSLYSSLWSPRKVSLLASLLSPEEQRSNENHLAINWSLEGPMNG